MIQTNIMIYGTEENRRETECARFVLNYLEKHGAQARVTLNKGCINSICILNGKTDRLQMSNDRALTIQVYYNNRYGNFSTNRLEKDELEKFADNALRATMFVEEDLARALPERELYYRGDNPDLGQSDSSIFTITDERKKEIAVEVCSSMEGNRYLVSAESEYNDYLDYQYIIDSQGFEAHSVQTDFDVCAQCSVRNGGDARYESYWYESAMHFNELDYKRCGIVALERGIAKFNPVKARSGKYNMIIENCCASRVVSPIINGLNGSLIQQKNSFLAGSLGKRVFGENVTFKDQPHRYGMAGSRYFDSEGIATKEMTFVENGIINNYFIDSYYSRKLNMPVTAESPSVPELVCCNKSEGEFQGTAELMREMDSGILVTGFNGGNCNGATGDFSYGIEGFRFRGGKIIHPVREMNITGNVVSLWNNLALAGKDPQKWAKWQIPSLAFENINFNGK